MRENTSTDEPKLAPTYVGTQTVGSTRAFEKRRGTLERSRQSRDRD